jgi:tripartite-type tricarboxylate transporter receptor subunit TctC
MESQGIDVAGSTIDQFKAYIQTETEKWGRVIKFANVKPETE